MSPTSIQLTLVLLQRVVFALGIVWGIVPLIGIPFLALGGGSGTALGDYSLVLTGLTILPASLLAFWFRRAAAVWFGLNALLTLAAIFFGHLIVSTGGPTILEFAVSSVALAAFVLFAELLHWPPALHAAEYSARP